jgi:hypothetical protein
MWEEWPTICTLSGHKKTNSNDRYLITALHDRHFTVLHGWYRNVYYSTYLYNFSFKPTNTLFGRITQHTICLQHGVAPIKEYQAQEEVTKTQWCRYHKINYAYIFLPWCNSPNGPRPPHYREIMITLRHTSLGRTPLDEWSAQCTDLCLTTHNTHKRQTSLPLVGFEPAIPASEQMQKYALDRVTILIGNYACTDV